MRFFVPHAADDAEGETVYLSIAKFVGAGAPAMHERRVFSLTWQHNGRSMQGEVGKPLPPYYRLGAEPVLAIFDCGNHYKICTPSRGGIRGDPVLAGADGSQAAYFSAE